MRLWCLSGDDLREALPMPAAVQAVQQAFAAYSTGRADVPLRTSMSIPEVDGTTLIMPCFLPGAGLGAKLVSVFPENRRTDEPSIQGIVILLDPATGAPLALLEGTSLTAWRTGAASGAATDLLALPEVREAAVIGAGPQARTQILAIDAVRPLQRIRVYARTPARVQALVDELQPLLDAELTPAASAESAVRGVPLVCTATSARTPVIDEAWLAPGTHINAVGSFTEDMRELDVATVRRAAVFVDAREAAAEEAGELMAAVREGATAIEAWTELGEVAAGNAPGREDRDALTLFKSVGLAVQDIAVAGAALSSARERGLGREITLAG